MASIERTAYPRFSQQLSDQELDARFGPTVEEAELVLRESHSDEARLTFLVMLKSLQQLGYFPLLDEVPEQVVAFLRTALNLPASDGSDRWPDQIAHAVPVSQSHPRPSGRAPLR